MLVIVKNVVIVNGINQYIMININNININVLFVKKNYLLLVQYIMVH